MAPFLADLPKSDQHTALKVIMTLVACNDYTYDEAERIVCAQLHEERMLALERVALSMQHVARG